VTRTISRSLLAIVLLSAGSAVADARETQAPSATEIEVLDAGSEPREALRLAPRAGASERSAMTMRFDLEQSGISEASVKAPPIRATIATALQDVTPNGELHVTFSYPSFEVLREEGTSTADRRAIERQLATLNGLSGEMTLTARGAVVDSKLDIPPDLDPALAQTVDQLRDQLGVLSPALPQEVVGVGARWRGMSQLELNGIEARQVAEYHLEKRNATTIELGVRGTQTARRQGVDAPGGGMLHVKRFKTAFRGSTTMDLTRLLPVDGRVRARGDQTFDVRSGDERGELRQHIDVRVEIEGA
jgi:hypothetical protein